MNRRQLTITLATTLILLCWCVAARRRVGRMHSSRRPSTSFRCLPPRRRDYWYFIRSTGKSA